MDDPLKELQSRIKDLYKEFDDQIEVINTKVRERYDTENWNGMYSLPDEYMDSYGKHVWGIRGKIIALHIIEGIIDELQSQPK